MSRYVDSLVGKLRTDLQRDKSVEQDAIASFTDKLVNIASAMEEMRKCVKTEVEHVSKSMRIRCDGLEKAT